MEKSKCPCGFSCENSKKNAFEPQKILKALENLKTSCKENRMGKII